MPDTMLLENGLGRAIVKIGEQKVNSHCQRTMAEKMMTRIKLVTMKIGRG